MKILVAVLTIFVFVHTLCFSLIPWLREGGKDEKLRNQYETNYGPRRESIIFNNISTELDSIASKFKQTSKAKKVIKERDLPPTYVIKVGDNIYHIVLSSKTYKIEEIKK